MRALPTCSSRTDEQRGGGLAGGTIQTKAEPKNVGTATSLHLNVFVAATGHHEASWRYPGTEPSRTVDIAYYRKIAQVAERGKFDSLFLADQLAIGRSIKHNAQDRLEPLTLLAALAGSTDRIGLIATASTTYTEPYNLARQFASLDHISAGRAGWNIVTSWSAEAAGNFGHDRLLSHADRYVRATEYLDVVQKLWDSWEDDARVIDRDAGIYADTSRIHPIDHRGALFKVRGALTLPRPPQGNPVLVQAGSSDDGRTFAARYAEAIFTAQQEIGDAQAFYTDVKQRVAAFGRDPEAVKILPGLSPILGSTTAEARALEDELDELPIPEVGLRHLSARFDGVDLSSFPLDGPVPLHALPKPQSVEGAQSRSEAIVNLVKRENLTLRQLLRRLAGGRGHRVLAGTPELIADHIIDWVEAGAADGFNIMPPYMPGGLEAFVESCRYCRSEACSAPIMRGRRCAITTDCPGRRIGSHRDPGRIEFLPPARTRHDDSPATTRTGPVDREPARKCAA
jgi:N-acetyl-S-(2-succino)cysteine monooxygenase